MSSQPAKSYTQQLSRSLSTVGNLGLTLSFLTPTVSLFLTASVLLTLTGTATFASFALAAIAAVAAAYCFAELGSSFPVVGGQYSIDMRVLGRPVGFIAFILFMTLVIFTISAAALIFGIYLEPIWHSVNVTLIGCVMTIVATVVSVFGIRFGALVTGAFLALELLVIVVVVIVGLSHAHQPVSTLWSLHSYNAHGHQISVGATGVISGIAIALFAYNGFDTAVVFSEETRGTRRDVGRVVMAAVAIAVVTELAAVIAIILGAPSLSAMVNSSAPISYVLNADGGSTLNDAISVGVAIALFNAIIASVLAMGRVVYSSARDNAYPQPVNGWLASIHPRFKTPWVATILLGVACTVLTALSDVATLVTFVSVVLCVLYVLVAISALVSRYTQRTMTRPFKMPLWPVPVVLVLIGVGLTLSKQKGSDLVIVGCIIAGSALYYAVYLLPRPNTHWIRLAPISTEEEPVQEPAPVAAP
jgi:amino acid transporter